MERRQYQKRLKAVRVKEDGLSFDSKSEYDFYLKLKKTFTDCQVLRPCELRLPGKVRGWKCDFGIVPLSTESRVKLTSLAWNLSLDATSPANSSVLSDRKHVEVLYIEFKGETDLSTGLCRIDKNFKSRVDWLVKYADGILESFVVVGNGTGGIVSYCANQTFRVTPIHSTEFFLKQGKELWCQA